MVVSTATAGKPSTSLPVRFAAFPGASTGRGFSHSGPRARAISSNSTASACSARRISDSTAARAHSSFRSVLSMTELLQPSHW